MVSPRQRREAVAWAQAAYQVSERRACTALMRRAQQHALCVHEAPGHGPAAALARAGHDAAHIRLATLAHDAAARRARDQLQARPSFVRRGRPAAQAAAETSAQSGHGARAARGGDAAARALGHGLYARALRRLRRSRVHAGGRVHARMSRTCRRSALQGRRRHRTAHACRARAGGSPPVIQCDNDTEFTSVALDHWAYLNHVQLDVSRPGKPVDNCVCEAFNGSVRRECLSMHWFVDLADAQQTLDAWRTTTTTHDPTAV